MMKKTQQTNIRDFSLGTKPVTELLGRSAQNVVTDEFAIVSNPAGLVSEFIGSGQVFRIGEARLIFCTSGSGHAIINMEDRVIKAGDVVMEEAGAIFEPVELSPDFCVLGVAFKHEVAGLQSLWTRPIKEEWEELLDLFNLLHRVAKHRPLRREIVEHLLRALVAGVVFTAKEGRAVTDHHGGRPAQLFRRFRRLAALHASTERSLAYYADRLCISPHYLGEIVKRVSGQPPLHWINRAAATHARILLHTERDMSITDVAYALNFPSATVFCKFFRRETGLTPTAYRRSLLAKV